MRGTVSFERSTSDPFPIKSGVKQGCVLALTVFGIIFSLLLSYAFGSSTDCVYIHTRTDGKLFNVARLRANTKVNTVLVCGMLFTDESALATHPRQHRLCGGSSTNSPAHLASQRVSKIPVWVQRMSVMPLKSKSAAILSRKSTNSPTSVPPTPWSSTLTQNSIPPKNRQTQRHNVQIDQERLGKQIPDWLKEPKCTSTRHAFSARCSTAVKLGVPTRDRSITWTLSICNASSASLASSGKTTSPTVRYSHVLEPQRVLPTQSARPEMAGAWS